MVLPRSCTSTLNGGLFWYSNRTDVEPTMSRFILYCFRMHSLSVPLDSQKLEFINEHYKHGTTLIWVKLSTIHIVPLMKLVYIRSIYSCICIIFYNDICMNPIPKQNTCMEGLTLNLTKLHVHKIFLILCHSNLQQHHTRTSKQQNYSSNNNIGNNNNNNYSNNNIDNNDDNTTTADKNLQTTILTQRSIVPTLTTI